MQKKKAVIFGAGQGAKEVINLYPNYEIIFMVDMDESCVGKIFECNGGGYPIRNMDELANGGFDVIILSSLSLFDTSYNLCKKTYLIPDECIIFSHLELPIKARIAFLEAYSKIVDSKQISGSICEVGVFKGDFAKEICRVFPTRTIYLFDTFEGFDNRDIAVEIENKYSHEKSGHFSITSEYLVGEKLKNHPDVRIRKGYFPESFNIDGETFCFVNLDTDLYQPTLSGLKIFYPLMEKHGVILIHDYFSKKYFGAKAATDEFCAEYNLSVVPIGDTLSVALIK